jgi:hypothetical protein
MAFSCPDLPSSISSVQPLNLDPIYLGTFLESHMTDVKVTAQLAIFNVPNRVEVGV